jgi:hypothetical protein
MRTSKCRAGKVYAHRQFPTRPVTRSSLLGGQVEASLRTPMPHPRTPAGRKTALAHVPANLRSLREGHSQAYYSGATTRARRRGSPLTGIRRRRRETRRNQTFHTSCPTVAEVSPCALAPGAGRGRAKAACRREVGPVRDRITQTVTCLPPGSLQNDKPAVTAAAIVATAPTPTAARVPTMPRESRIASLSGTVKSSHLYRRKIELVGGLSRRCVSPAGMAEDWRFGCSAGDGSARADVRRKGGRGQGEGRAPPYGGRPSRDDGGDARRPRWNIGRI